MTHSTPQTMRENSGLVSPTILKPPSIPRPEYPRPQFVRADWLNLNGYCQFEADPGDSGIDRGPRERDLEGRILVPFAPESHASEIETVDFLHAIWSRWTLQIPAEWAGRNVLLHFGAVDHDATVWANGIEVVRHRRGFSSFTASLVGIAVAGDQVTIVVRSGDSASPPQARGKQSTWYGNTDCSYASTTGPWQTMWLETVPPAHIAALNIAPQRADSSFLVAADVTYLADGLRLEAILADECGEVASASVKAGDHAPRIALRVSANRGQLWCPEDPHPYDLRVRLRSDDGVVGDAESYAGLRSVAISGNRNLRNGKPVIPRSLLDQGYWPDSLMTAPDDAALRRNIELSMVAGFNGTRLHLEVFEDRFPYYADRLGSLVWGEFGDWGVSGNEPEGCNQEPNASFIAQWREVVTRDRNHPSIIGWCPLSETQQVLHGRVTQLDSVTAGMYLATKASNPTRPVIDASGYSHRVRGADVCDSHSYEQNPERFRAQQAVLRDGRPHVNDQGGIPISYPYSGQPSVVSEYWGIWWNAERLAEEQHSADDPNRDTSWGYGQRVDSLEAWHERFEGLARVLLDDAGMFGYCCAQLTDMLHEENGLYDFYRRENFDIERLRAVQIAPAAYELAAVAAHRGES